MARRVLFQAAGGMTGCPGGIVPPSSFRGDKHKGDTMMTKFVTAIASFVAAMLLSAPALAQQQEQEQQQQENKGQDAVSECPPGQVLTCPPGQILVYAPVQGEATQPRNFSLLHGAMEHDQNLHAAPPLTTPFGMEAQVGGGVIGFTDPRMAAYANVGGDWTARLIFGTRSVVAVEAAYVGSAQRINALGLTGNALLVGNGVEGDVRINFLTGMWQPYLAGGVTWTHYSLTNYDTNTSAVDNADNTLGFPASVGLAMRYHGAVLDLRGTLMPVTDAEMISAPNQPGMHNWSANLKLGWEF